MQRKESRDGDGDGGGVSRRWPLRCGGDAMTAAAEIEREEKIGQVVRFAGLRPRRSVHVVPTAAEASASIHEKTAYHGHKDPFICLNFMENRFLEK